VAKLRNHLFITFLLTTSLAAFEVLSPVAAYANNDVVLYASKAPVRSGSWQVVADSTAAGGFAMATANKGAATVTTPLASPTNYFQLTFPAYAGTAYHLWIRGKAANNAYTNDSVYVQFSDTVTSTGSAVYRIGTTSGAAVVLQSCTGALEQGWGWADNGWCGQGANLQFSTTGTHTIRIQVREDGLSIDQIVLSPQTYLTAAPGVQTNDKTLLAANVPTLTQSLTASISASPSAGASPLNVNLTANVSGATPSSYQWNFGDGQTSTAALPSHVYSTPGNYTTTVTVKDSAGATATAASLISVTGTSSQVKLRVVEANISYGGHGTDNIINLARTVSWLVKLNPDVASLIETIGGYNDPALITGLMKQQTGLTWYSYYVPKYVGCSEGVMILSKWPIVSTAPYYMSYQMPIAEATLNVNGKLVSFFSTHFQWPSTASSERQVEAKQLVAFASKFAEPRIIAGDLNAQVGTPEVDIILQNYFGGWDVAVSKGAATAYYDNPPGMYTRSRKSRIDHIFYSKGASTVSVSGGQMPDQRAANTAGQVVVKLGTTDDKGVRPSDHNFMEVTFAIN
jgi:PKD repeat protein